MTNNKPTDETLALWRADAERIMKSEDVTTEAHAAARVIAELSAELQERRKANTPELKPVHLINKFYERYPLAGFKTDSERSEALGYFMAGAELQCFGEFINYAELLGDE